MKHKTADLEGALLDAAVAKANAFAFNIESYMTNPPRPVACWLVDAAGRPDFSGPPYWPATDWGVGGPIIERERIMVTHTPAENGVLWCATADEYASEAATGPTPLIAAMRAFVASKFGDEVELP
jgi:hypothetical protein